MEFFGQRLLGLDESDFTRDYALKINLDILDGKLVLIKQVEVERVVAGAQIDDLTILIAHGEEFVHDRSHRVHSGKVAAAHLRRFVLEGDLLIQIRNGREKVYVGVSPIALAHRIRFET